MKSRILVWPIMKKLQIPEEWQGKNTAVVSTVSHSEKKWERGLSPFILGPCKLWGGHVSKTMENLWQYSKVYQCHMEDPFDVDYRKWLKWAKEGWDNPKAVRYPMGKGKKPVFSYWDGNTYAYVPARKQIYGPAYLKAVDDTEAYDKLFEIYNKVDKLVLLDYDAYDHHKLDMTLTDVLNNPNKKMGHAFVLAMMLEDDKALDQMAL